MASDSDLGMPLLVPSVDPRVSRRHGAGYLLISVPTFVNTVYLRHEDPIAV